MNTPDPAKEALQEALKDIDAYRTAVLTASGLLITIPFLSESILVAFGHFTRIGIVSITIPMVCSAIAFSLTIYLIIGAFRRLAQAAGVQLSLDLFQLLPEDTLKGLSEDSKRGILKELESIVERPTKYRRSSARWFSSSEVTFFWGVLFLVVSLVFLALNLIL